MATIRLLPRVISVLSAVQCSAVLCSVLSAGGLGNTNINNINNGYACAAVQSASSSRECTVQCTARHTSEIAYYFHNTVHT